jgi:hypothetical protein
MKASSRMLLALVAVVVVLRNYQAFISGFQSIGAPAPGSASVPTPGQAYAANPSAPVITASNVTGTTAGAGTPGTNAPVNPFDPNAFLAAYQSASAGFGGVA